MSAAFETNRDELWRVFVADVPPHGYITEVGEHGDGRAYYVLNRERIAAFHEFCDRKESALCPLTPESVSDRSGVVCRPTEGET